MRCAVEQIVRCEGGVRTLAACEQEGWIIVDLDGMRIGFCERHRAAASRISEAIRYKRDAEVGRREES